MLAHGANIEEKDDRGLIPLLCLQKLKEKQFWRCVNAMRIQALQTKKETTVAMLVDQQLMNARSTSPTNTKRLLHVVLQTQESPASKVADNFKKRQEMDKIKQNKLALQKSLKLMIFSCRGFVV